MGLVLTPQPSILGTGPAFPMQLDPTGTRIKVLSEQALVKADMLYLLQTNIGERPFLVKNGPLGVTPFGTNLFQALFQDAESAADVIQFETKRALITWEPRIIYMNTTVTVLLSGNLTTINANTRFQFRSTSRVDNLVVPYSLQAQQ